MTGLYDSTADTLDVVALGSRLRQTRVARGLTQAQLAGDDISHAYVSRIEAGQRRPDVSVLRLLAGRLGTTVEFLVSGLEGTRAEETRLTVQYAELALHSGEARDAERQLAPLFEKLAELGPLARELEWVWARCQEALGRLAEAAEILERLTEDQSHAYWLSAAVALGRCYRNAGDLTRSIEIGERSLAVAERMGLAGCDDGIRLIVSLVGAYYERGDVLYATQLCRTALERAEAAATPAARASAYWNASIVASRSGQFDDAVRLAGSALVLMSDDEDQRTVAKLRQRYATLLLRQEASDPHEAERQVRQARDSLSDGPGTVVDLAWCDLTLGETQLALGELDSAERSVEQAATGVGAEAPFVAAEAQLVLGRIAWQRGDRSLARKRFRSAVGALTGAQADRQAGTLWFELGQMLDEVGDTARARDAYRSAAAASGLMPTIPLRVAQPAVRSAG